MSAVTTRTTDQAGHTLDAMLDGIHVDLPALAATIDGHRFTASDRRQLESELGRRLYELRHVRRPDVHPVTMPRRDSAAEQQILSRIGRRPKLLPVSQVHHDGAEVFGTVMGLRVRLEEPVERVELSDVWPAISPGFLMVFGPRPPVPVGQDQIWRLYVAASALDEAVGLFGATVDFLRERVGAWQAKITSQPVEFPRSDAITVYLQADELRHLPELVDHLTPLTALLPRQQTSQFVDRLGPGIGLAQEAADPDPRRVGLSYGQHRASLLARHALARAAGRPSDAGQLLSQAGVDPDRPWRNLPTLP